MGSQAKNKDLCNSLSAKANHTLRFHSMRPFPIVLTLAALLSSIALSVGQQAVATTAAVVSPAPARESADQKTASILIPTFLDATLDSKKRNAGDEITASIAAPIELSDGRVLARGAKVTGHVTESKARAKGDSESSLTIVFEKVAMPDGKVMNIKGYLQAVAPNPNQDQSGSGVDYGNSLNRSMQHSGGGETTHTATPILNAQSVGVQGIKDLALNDDGVLTSPGKAVKLDHGAQIMLRAQIAAQ
jgi:hypothetical protein